MLGKYNLLKSTGLKDIDKWFLYKNGGNHWYKDIVAEIINMYKKLGYEPIIVPFMNISKRVDFILSKVKTSKPSLAKISLTFPHLSLLDPHPCKIIIVLRFWLDEILFLLVAL